MYNRLTTLIRELGKNIYMNKLNKLFTVFAIMLITAFAFSSEIKLGKPRAQQPAGFGTLSVGSEYDGSLLKGLVFFDGLSSQYIAASYDIGQLDGLFAKPIRVGVAGAAKGEDKAWGGLAFSYELLNNGKYSLGFALGMPGFNYSEGKFTLPDKLKLIPGLNFSVTFRT